MIMIEICERFGWTYNEYVNQPTFFIDLIKEKMRIDSQKQNKK